LADQEHVRPLAQGSDLLESAREEAWTRRKRTREPTSKSEHNKAVHALQAVHVEAPDRSGLNAKSFVEAHHISVYSPARVAPGWTQIRCRSTGVCIFTPAFVRR